MLCLLYIILISTAGAKQQCDWTGLNSLHATPFERETSIPVILQWHRGHKGAIFIDLVGSPVFRTHLGRVCATCTLLTGSMPLDFNAAVYLKECSPPQTPIGVVRVPADLAIIKHLFTHIHSNHRPTLVVYVRSTDAYSTTAHIFAYIHAHLDYDTLPLYPYYTTSPIAVNYIVHPIAKITNTLDVILLR